MMSSAIRAFPSQFSYEPKLENTKKNKPYKQYVLLGMGGSHLAADLAKIISPSLPLIIHSDYGLPGVARRAETGLPALPEAILKQSLIIASSYSGNTEEVIDGLKVAKKKKLPIVCVAVGGKLIELAKKFNLPYIQMPDTGIQPRSALGFSLKALLKVFGDEKNLRLCKQLAKTLNPEHFEKEGKALAERLKDSIPVIYSSTVNKAIAYNWKIKLNETGKIPAFYNVIPELNHNEMNGFDVKPGSRALSEHFYFLLLADSADHPRNKKRMDILEQLYRDRGLRVERLRLTGKNIFEKIFNSLLLADWTAVYTAEQYGLESEHVPMIEEFKNLMK